MSPLPSWHEAEEFKLNTPYPGPLGKPLTNACPMLRDATIHLSFNVHTETLIQRMAGSPRARLIVIEPPSTVVGRLRTLSLQVSLGVVSKTVDLSACLPKWHLCAIESAASPWTAMPAFRARPECVRPPFHRPRPAHQTKDASELHER